LSAWLPGKEEPGAPRKQLFIPTGKYNYFSSNPQENSNGKRRGDSKGGGGGFLPGALRFVCFLFLFKKRVFDGVADKIIQSWRAYDFKGFHVPEIFDAMHGVGGDDPDIAGS
jgi:hypothetical protein